MGSRLCRWVLCFALLLLASFANGTPVSATDDNENSAPTAWRVYTGQTVGAVTETIDSKNLRIVDISPDPSSTTFTVSHVRKTGAYDKTWCDTPASRPRTWRRL